MTTGRILGVRATLSQTVGRILGVRATIPITGTRGRIMGVKAVGGAQFVVDAGDDLQHIEPYSQVDLEVSATGGTVTDWLFEVVGNEIEVTFGGTGNERWFIAPAVFGGIDFEIRVTATGTGALPGSALLSVNVLPHIEFEARNGVWSPVHHQTDW